MEIAESVASGIWLFFFEIAFFGSILISLIWTVNFLKKDDERRKNTCPTADSYKPKE